ncbi:chaperonin 10-like protein [Aspergillus spinulosporus]
MRAVQFYAAGDVRVEDVPVPQASDDRVLIEVEWCGICGSDLNEYMFGPFAIPSPQSGPHPLTNAMRPVTMGHEFTGRIQYVPESISHLKKGQAVVVDPRYYCSSCTPCLQNATNSCEMIGFVGLSGGGGGLSEFVAVRPEAVHVLSWNGSADVDLAAAALIEPLAVAWHALGLFLSISPCQTTHKDDADLSTIPILVIGAGPVGVAMCYVLRARGAKTIYVSEVSQARRETLHGMNIVAKVFDSGQIDVPKEVRMLTGDGVGVVFDCAGSQAGFDAGCQSLRFKGVYINLAVPKGPMTLPLAPFMWKEVIYKSSLAYNQDDFKDVVNAFLAGRFQGVEKMITNRLSLEDIVEKGFKELIKPNSHIKILDTPKRESIKRGVAV